MGDMTLPKKSFLQQVFSSFGPKPEELDIQLRRARIEFDVDQLVRKGVDINRQDEYGNTPLMSQIQAGKEDVARAILKHDPNMALKNHAGLNALEFAQKELAEAQEIGDTSQSKALNNLMHELERATETSLGVKRAAEAKVLRQHTQATKL